MNSSPLNKLKEELASNTLYEWLVSTNRSEEFATSFLEMNVDIRRLTKREMRKIANLFGKSLSKKMARVSSSLNEAQKKRLTKKCLNEALRLFKQ